jgi:predicted methyltransferase
MQLTQLAHEKLSLIIQPGDVVVDATIGNGYDTCFLAERVGADGMVIGFDIQARAITATTARLKEHALFSRVRLQHTSHADLALLLQPHIAQRRCSAIVFNLGYLPGSDKSITTQITSTLQALQAGFQILATSGCISALLYSGHPGGTAEAEAVKSWSQTLPTNDAHIEHIAPTNIQTSTPPELLFIQKI